MTASQPSRPLRVLYLYPDTMGPEPDPRLNALAHLSKYLEGDMLAVWWVPDSETARRQAPELERALGRFSFHWTRSYRLPPVVRQLWDIAFYIGNGLRLRLRRGRYDVIVAYGPFRTGFAGCVLKFLLGTKLILEIPGNYRKSFAVSSTGLLGRLKGRVAPSVIAWVARRADHVRLLYPTQLDGIVALERDRTSVFHEFVPLSTMRADAGSEKYIFFLGHPWFLNGVDVLIKAWNTLWRDFPEYRLLIVGHCPDRTPFLELVGDNPTVEFQKGTPRPQAMEIMARCALFVLPSRTEAMGRVLLEAMAAGKPVIASAVDGIPHYVKDGETGLLFRSEDVEHLAAQLRRVLSDPAFAARLASAGMEHARTALSEERYVEHFREMVELTLAPRGTVSVAEARG